MKIIEANQIHKSFQVGEQTIEVLKGIDFSVETGSFDIIFGPSGSGKSTLLHAILGLEPPTKGTVKILGEDMYQNTDEDDRAEFRKSHIGMVYQQSNWVKSINVLNNVALPLMFLGIPKEERNKRAMQSLEMFKMTNWSNHHPSELSSGQQQKVSLARALVIDPELIVADEPTGNLDYESGIELMELLSNLSKNLKKTVLMVTHDLNYLSYADDATKVIDGTVTKDFNRSQLIGKSQQNV